MPSEFTGPPSQSVPVCVRVRLDWFRFKFRKVVTPLRSRYLVDPVYSICHILVTLPYSSGLHFLVILRDLCIETRLSVMEMLPKISWMVFGAI